MLAGEKILSFKNDPEQKPTISVTNHMKKKTESAILLG
jgi:hypothetical protein